MPNTTFRNEILTTKAIGFSGFRWLFYFVMTLIVNFPFLLLYLIKLEFAMAKKEVVSITLEELTQHIASAIKENLIVHKGVVLNEGVRYDDNSDMFIFDFENDNETDLIQLKKVVYKVTAFNHCYYYAYEFTENVDSASRTSFIHSIKFPDGRITEQDKNTFIVNAVNKLDSDISLPSYKLIVYPESMSELNRDMLGYLNRFASPEIVNMELVSNC